MCTTFLDTKDKQLVDLALEFESAGKTICLEGVVRAHAPQITRKNLVQRLRALKRTYGKGLAHFPPCSSPGSRLMPPKLPKIRLLQASRSEGAV
eukprot:jgi/Phyca11/122416/e_gw1.48.349.1